MCKCIIVSQQGLVHRITLPFLEDLKLQELLKKEEIATLLTEHHQVFRDKEHLFDQSIIYEKDTLVFLLPVLLDARAWRRSRLKTYK